MNDKVAWMQLSSTLKLAIHEEHISTSNDVVKFVKQMLTASEKGFQNASAEEALSAISHLFKSHNARDAVGNRYKHKREVKEAIRKEYIRDKAGYESKADFCRIYAPLIKQRFGYDISYETVYTRWLKGL
jgi:hypothetical protein